MTGFRFDAVIPAGGAGRRIGGLDKASLLLDGTSLLDRVVTAVGSAERIVCVGPARATSSEVEWVREEPAGGGPAAALAAALPLLESPTIVVMACDLPFMHGKVVEQLLEASAQKDGAVLRDEEDRPQYLAAAYQRAFLRDRLSDMEVEGASLKSLLAGADLASVSDGVAAQDVDTPSDLVRLSLAGGDQGSLGQAT